MQSIPRMRKRLNVARHHKPIRHTVPMFICFRLLRIKVLSKSRKLRSLYLYYLIPYYLHSYALALPLPPSLDNRLSGALPLSHSGAITFITHTCIYHTRGETAGREMREIEMT
jgi:hypothetical protein